MNNTGILADTCMERVEIHDTVVTVVRCYMYIVLVVTWLHVCQRSHWKEITEWYQVRHQSIFLWVFSTISKGNCCFMSDAALLCSSLVTSPYVCEHFNCFSSTWFQVFADSAVEFPFNRVQYAVKASVSMATLVKSRLLTGEGSLKKTLELEFSIEV